MAPWVPPVNHSARTKKSCRMNWAASVAMARYSPFTRAAGRPNRRPTAVVHSPASTMASGTGTPLLARKAEANPPKPKNTAWPTEICPEKPTRMFNPSAAMPR